MIPRIIHQTWKTADVPENLRFFQGTWLAHHPDWEYRFWTDADCRDFIASWYPNFLPIYDGYQTPICRVDAVRYFLLRHYGGVYADLDFECLRPLDRLLDGRGLVVGLEPASHVAMHMPAARLKEIVCNAFMASEPRHPFWDHVIARLVESRGEPSPLDATGPFFLTRALASYRDQRQVSLMPAELLYPADTWDCSEGRLFDLEQWRRLTARAYAIHHWVGTWHRPEGSQESRRPLPSAQARARLLEHGQVIADSVVHARVVDTAEMPLVSCLMVTRDRAARAQRAIRCFQAQTYPARELVILDDGEDDALADWIASQRDDRIQYHRLPTGTTPLGALRNRSVALASGDYVCQWDDDDLYDPARIETQMILLRALDAEACLLSRWLIWWPLQERLAVSTPRLWEGSLLCAKARLTPYPETLRRGEDTPVIERLIASSRVVLLDQPRLYLYVVHQDNTFDPAHFEQHWEAASLRFESEDYARVGQELRKRLDLDGYLEAIGRLEPVVDDAAIDHPSEGAAFTHDESQAVESVPPSRTATTSPWSPTVPWPTILILTPIKNAARFIPVFFENLLKLDYPREKLSVAFLEGDSDDDTWSVLQSRIQEHAHAFARIEASRLDFAFRFDCERWQPHLQFRRRAIIGKSRSILFQRAWRGEDWVLWIDADVIQYPSDVLRHLLASGQSIVVPNCVKSRGGATFDLNTFRLKPGARSREWQYFIDGNIQTPRGQGRLYLDDLRGQELVELDGVGGTMLLVKSEIHAQGILFPDYAYRGYLDTEGFAMQARDRGLTCWGLPDLEIIHAPE